MNKQDKLTQCLKYHVGDIDWDRFHVPTGLIIELGVAGGGSFTRICDYFQERACFGFDSFYGLPETYKPGVEKGQFNMNGVLPEVRPNGVLVPGYIEETLKHFLWQQERSIAFVNFDLDLYKPTYYALMVMDFYFKRGTILRFDEILDPPESEHHEEKAMREWLEITRFDFKCIGTQGGHSRVFKLL